LHRKEHAFRGVNSPLPLTTLYRKRARIELRRRDCEFDLSRTRAHSPQAALLGDGYAAGLINVICSRDISANTKSIDNPIIEGWKIGMVGLEGQSDRDNIFGKMRKIENVHRVTNCSHRLSGMEREFMNI